MTRYIAGLLASTAFLILISLIIVKLSDNAELNDMTNDLQTIRPFIEEGFVKKVSNGIYEKNGIVLNIDKGVFTLSDGTPLILKNTKVKQCEKVDEYLIVTDTNQIVNIPANVIYLELEHQLAVGRKITKSTYVYVGN